MPSPFPGMDPYLEGSLWDSFHAEFIGEMARELSPKVQPKYLTHVERRFVPDFPEELVVSSTQIYPDVSVGVHQPGIPAMVASAALTIDPPLQMETVLPTQVPQRSLMIRDRAERRLVAAIELLSPTNKQGSGRAAYLERRDKFLSSTAHLIEIDLLRRGARVPMKGHLPSTPYFIFVSRFERRPLTDIWPISLRVPLPPIPVPLLSGDGDATLDLQAAFTATYDLFGYRLEIDYARPPEIPLADDDAAWVATRTSS